jgi:SAM-dependent methyltransferase
MNRAMSSLKWDPERYRSMTGYVSELGTPLLDLLDARPGERILDVGCGEGTLARTLMEHGVNVIGVDSSAEMVAAARELGVEAYVMDGQQLSFQEEFDAVYSNAALHWMRNAEAVITGIRASLVPNGRFVAEFGGDGNISGIIGAIRESLSELDADHVFNDPWFFPSESEYRGLLADNGLAVESVVRIPRPTPLKFGLRGWLSVFALPVLDSLPPKLVEPFLSRCESYARPHLWSADRGWIADYVRLRCIARRDS